MQTVCNLDWGVGYTEVPNKIHQPVHVRLYISLDVNFTWKKCFTVDMILIKWPKVTSSVMGKMTDVCFWWCTEKNMASLLWYFCQHGWPEFYHEETSAELKLRSILHNNRPALFKKHDVIQVKESPNNCYSLNKTKETWPLIVKNRESSPCLSSEKIGDFLCYL